MTTDMTIDTAAPGEPIQLTDDEIDAVGGAGAGDIARAIVLGAILLGQYLRIR